MLWQEAKGLRAIIVYRFNLPCTVHRQGKQGYGALRIYVNNKWRNYYSYKDIVKCFRLNGMDTVGIPNNVIQDVDRPCGTDYSYCNKNIGTGDDLNPESTGCYAFKRKGE